MEKGKSQAYSNNDDAKLDLTLRLSLTVSNEEKLHNFMGLGGDNSNKKVNFGMQYGPAASRYSACSSAYGGRDDIYAEPLLGLSPLASFAPYGNGASSIMSSYNKVYWPVETNFANYLRKSPFKEDKRLCKSCGTKNSPAWRKGPCGAQTLCNACGLKHARYLKKSSN